MGTPIKLASRTHILIETEFFKVNGIAPFGIVVNILGAHVETSWFYHDWFLALLRDWSIRHLYIRSVAGMRLTSATSL